MELNGWSSPQMLARYGASARSARARRTYDRIMTTTGKWLGQCDPSVTNPTNRPAPASATNRRSARRYVRRESACGLCRTGESACVYAVIGGA